MMRGIGALLLFAALCGGVHAQPAYPAKPIRMVVPFPPGGGTDIIARYLADPLGQRLREPVVIDNRPGAATNIGMDAVAKAAPDGYTLLMATITLTSNASLYKSLPFDPARAFAPVSLVVNAPTLLVANARFAPQSPADIVAYTKAHPNEVNYASYGPGSGAHLAAELFRSITGADMVHIPYKGGGPATTAVLTGEVQLLFSSVLPVMSNVAAGKLRPVAIASKRRMASLPGVPTFIESGIDYVTGTWFGVLAPAGTPKAVVERLSREIVAIAATEDFRKRVAAEGAEVIGDSPAEFAEFLRHETARWAATVKAAHIQPD